MSITSRSCFCGSASIRGFATVARQIDLESLLVEPLVEQPPELGVVLDNQDVQVHVIAASVIRSNDRWQT